jgi:hypothetical protein
LNSLFLEKDPDPLSPITPGFLGPVITLFYSAGDSKLESIPQTGWKRYQRQKIISNSSREYKEHYCSRKM